MKRCKRKIVHVEWEDAVAIGPGWRSSEAWQKQPHEPLIIHTIGTLVRRDKKHTIVALSQGGSELPDGDDYMQLQVVPNVMVRSYRVIGTY